MPCSNLRFLVIEDHDFQRQTLCRLLLQLGAEAVFSAPNARDGLARLQDDESPVDAVILDLMMPGMDGIEFLRHFRHAAPGMPLIVVSASDSALLSSVRRVAEGYRIELLGLLQKPATAAKLATMTDALRSRQRQQSGASARFSVREIADAWTRDEFHPRFEPKVDLISGTVVAMDVVPAWSHPTLGLLPSSAFMPCLQARGFEAEFQLLMLEKSFARCQKWSQRGTQLAISAELGGDSLNDPRIVQKILELSGRFAMNPAAVVLQIALGESQLNPRMLEALTRLRLKGFGIGLCHATGAAADALDLVPFSELRIAAPATPKAVRVGSAKLKGFVEAARHRKVRTVGTGMKSKHDWMLLQECGCDLAQGPFVSPPIEGRAVPRWMQDRAASVIR